jgi:hypothetical protein
VPARDYGALSVKSQTTSGDAVYPFENAANGVIRAAYRIVRNLPAALVK